MAKNTPSKKDLVDAIDTTDSNAAPDVMEAAPEVVSAPVNAVNQVKPVKTHGCRAVTLKESRALMRR